VIAEIDRSEPKAEACANNRPRLHIARADDHVHHAPVARSALGRIRARIRCSAIWCAI
jgi:hypothetical protein